MVIDAYLVYMIIWPMLTFFTRVQIGLSMKSSFVVKLFGSCPCNTSMTNLAVFSVIIADSLRFTSALSIGLAVLFLIIAVGISVIKIISGGIGMPRLFPVITDAASVFDLFTVVPVLMTAYVCHYNGIE
jgi:hypothetical protein